jgi:hypothetical protein
MNKEQMYEEMQVRLENNKSSFAGGMHRLNRFVKDCIEHSDRKLDKQQMRRLQRRAKQYTRTEVSADEFEGVNP